jgi:hypothetical protein
VHTQAGGLEATLDVLIGGPYFLSELLPVDVSLTNHTQQTVMLAGDDRDREVDLCFSAALMVQITTGSAPSFPLPSLAYSCDLLAVQIQVKPGQTITVHQYLPLTKSNAVTLTMGPFTDYPPAPPAYDFTGPLKDHWPNLPGPLAGHWPSIQIQVNPQVPQDRALTLQQQQGQVTITIPAGARGHLLYMQSVTCGGESASYGNGAGPWAPLLTSVLHEPTCPYPHPQWGYAVSAPGYAIVSGSQLA